eukprot:jgi/Mesvir1/323/Mv26048-RA.1
MNTMRKPDTAGQESRSLLRILPGMVVLGGVRNLRKLSSHKCPPGGREEG